MGEVIHGEQGLSHGATPTVMPDRFNLLRLPDLGLGCLDLPKTRHMAIRGARRRLPESRAARPLQLE